MGIINELGIRENAIRKAEELCEEVLQSFSNFINIYGNPLDANPNIDIDSDVKSLMKETLDTETLLDDFTNSVINACFDVTKNVMENTQTFDDLGLKMDYYVNELDSHLSLYNSEGQCYSDANIIDGISYAFERSLMDVIEETIKEQSNYADLDFDMTMEFITDFLNGDYISTDEIQKAVYENEITENLTEGIRAALEELDLVNPNPAITIEGYYKDNYSGLAESVTVGSQDKANEVIWDMLNTGYFVETHTDEASHLMRYSPEKLDAIRERDGDIADYSVLEEIGEMNFRELDLHIDSAVSIALAIDDFYYDYDTYGYMDNLEVGEFRSDNVHKIEQEIYSGNVQGYLDGISKILTNDTNLDNSQITALKNIVDSIDVYMKEYFSDTEKEIKKPNLEKD